VPACQEWGATIGRGGGGMLRLNTTKMGGLSNTKGWGDIGKKEKHTKTVKREVVEKKGPDSQGSG